MTAQDIWQLISSGGGTAALVIMLWLILTERLVTGTQYRREIDRNQRLDQENRELLRLQQRTVNVIDTYTSRQHSD